MCVCQSLFFHLISLLQKENNKTSSGFKPGKCSTTLSTLRNVIIAIVLRWDSLRKRRCPIGSPIAAQVKFSIASQYRHLKVEKKQESQKGYSRSTGELEKANELLSQRRHEGYNSKGKKLCTPEPKQRRTRAHPSVSLLVYVCAGRSRKYGHVQR